MPFFLTYSSTFGKHACMHFCGKLDVKIDTTLFSFSCQKTSRDLGSDITHYRLFLHFGFCAMKQTRYNVLICELEVLVGGFQSFC